MTYFPVSGLTAAAGTDSAGGTVSRTILAAGAVHSQSDENRFRSSILDAYNALRTKFQGAVGKNGGGYRPLTSVGALSTVGGGTGSTIPAAGVAYLQANENEFRSNMGALINALRADMASAGFISGPRGAAYTRLTDNSGGSVTDLNGAGGVYSQSAQNGTRATLAAKLEAIANALGA